MDPEATAPPTVIGPVGGAARPFGAPPEADLSARGYLAEEYFLEGRARAYAAADGVELGRDGRWEVEAVGEAGYRTRLLVVRPTDPARCNGTVVVHWQNVSAGYEMGRPDDEVYSGYAWVGVSAQEVGLYGSPLAQRWAGGALPLLEHDPDRYGSLHHPGDQASFDIFTAAGRAVGPGRAADHVVDPLGGIEVHRLVATGGSQSAMRLVTYLNAWQARTGVFDGFLLSVWEGIAPRPEEGAMALGTKTVIRDDLATPVIVVNSEFEAPRLAELDMADTDHLRIWEVAGTAHGTVRGARSAADLPDRRGRVANRLTWAPVHNAALRALHRWLADGVPARAQPRMAYDKGLVRDEHGNAVGGIRLPELAAPTHEYRGVAIGTGRAPLFGSALPLPDDVLRALYPDRAAYVARWEAAVDALVAGGAVRPEDAPTMKARASEVALPEP